MKIDPDTGWTDGVRRIESPNADERPSDCKAELIVIHGISLPPGDFGGTGIDELFTNSLDVDAHPYYKEVAHLRVSSHVLIARDGTLTQYVSFANRAWHAGESNYCGRGACNDFSIGIELEGTDDCDYELVQYQQLATLVSELHRAYPCLRDAEIVGHSDIAPGRKTDPGPCFDWDLLSRLLAS
jgi:AmpD protein